MSQVAAYATDEDRGQMKLTSVNTGLPREVTWHGRTVTTGIFKEPVHSRVLLRKLNLDGDRQADLSVHGGPHKAVYCYPLAHYEYWKAELPGRELPMGIFGENFTLDGLLDEESVHLGDQFSIGSAEVVVTQPRLPCYKLGIRFEADDMVKRFFASRRTGFYLAVTREGEVGAGDEMRLISRDPNIVPVAEITRLYAEKRYSNDDVAWVQRTLRVAALPESWKEYFRDRLAQIPTSGYKVEIASNSSRDSRKSSAITCWLLSTRRALTTERNRASVFDSPVLGSNAPTRI